MTLTRRHLDALARFLADGEQVVAVHDHDAGGDVETGQRELRVARWDHASACEVLVVRDLNSGAVTQGPMPMAIAVLLDGSVVSLRGSDDLTALLARLRDTLTAAEAAALLASFATEHGHTVVPDTVFWSRLTRGAPPPDEFVTLQDGPLIDRATVDFCTAFRSSLSPLAPLELWRWRLDLAAEPIRWASRPIDAGDR